MYANSDRQLSQNEVWECSYRKHGIQCTSRVNCIFYNFTPDIHQIPNRPHYEQVTFTPEVQFIWFGKKQDNCCLVVVVQFVFTLVSGDVITVTGEKFWKMTVSHAALSVMCLFVLWCHRAHKEITDNSIDWNWTLYIKVTNKYKGRKKVVLYHVFIPARIIYLLPRDPKVGLSVMLSHHK